MVARFTETDFTPKLFFDGGNKIPRNPGDDFDDDDDDGTFDPNNDGPGEDFVKKYDVDMLDSPQFLESLFLSNLRGGLSSFLSVYSLGDDESVARVRRILDSHYPTLEAESVELFRLIEQELVKIGVGGAANCCELTGMSEEDSYKLVGVRLQTLSLLFAVRKARLKLKANLNNEAT